MSIRRFRSSEQRSVRRAVAAPAVAPFSRGMMCGMAAAAGGVSFLALEADAAVTSNAALGVMADKAVNKALTSASTGYYALKIKSAGATPAKMTLGFIRSNYRYIPLFRTGIAILNDNGLKNVKRIASGDEINAAQTKWTEWTIGPRKWSYLNGPMPATGPAKGNFNGQTGYIGIRFTASIKGGGSGLHYGWIKYSGGNYNRTGTIHSYAYKVAVDAPIKAAGPQAALKSAGSGAVAWTARSEEGIARYDVERQSAGGAWESAETVLPGKGEYRVDGLGAAPCRVLAVGVDGACSVLD